MKEEINKIKELLDKIEKSQDTEMEKSFKQSFELFELPEIVSSIIDYLQPLLLPYESAIYWYLFRHSIINNGDNHIRVSNRGLGKPRTVLTSSSGQSEGLSYGAVQKALSGLEEKGAIRKVGDTNREGTLFQIFLPDEIEICQQRMKEIQVEELPKIDPKKEADYYNIKENRYKIFERDGYKCHYCDKQLTRFSATLDHIQPVSECGDNSFDNLVTSCLHCNSKRGAKPVMEAIIDNKKSE
ncbi:MAG: HNH endonuclease [Candidatus Marinimicrobia bacterium]|nr:HNH endonuclease [Candidatus Neomarinimicrobiota bacterium]